MKQYVIDELRPGEYDKIKKYLDEKYPEGNLDDLYWIPFKPELYNEKQKSHKECQPYYFTIDLDENYLACELLIRTRERISCDCIAYADKTQRDYIIETADSIFKELEIII